FGPDTLEWQCLGAGHGAWLSWLASGATSQFYESLRWPTWQAETRALPLSHGLSVYPFLWSQEAQQNLAGTSRTPTPMTEVFSLQDEFTARFAAEPDATAFHIRLTE